MQNNIDLIKLISILGVITLTVILLVIIIVNSFYIFLFSDECYNDFRKLIITSLGILLFAMWLITTICIFI